MKTLNLIGAGRVGRTLTALWHESQVFRVQDVLSRTVAGSRSAVRFIGAGQAVRRHADLRPAAVWLIATPDGALAETDKLLAASGRLRRGDIVFHCSGALPSSLLSASRRAGARVASIHPLKTFANARDALNTFAGTYCAVEGDAQALAVLKPAFRRVGARMLAIDARRKVFYHAASVIVCNYLTALLDVGGKVYGRAGLAHADALRVMEPLVRETIDNVFRLGPAAALTGPIARGDAEVVAKQLDALVEWDPAIGALYRELGLATVTLARSRAGSRVNVQRVRTVLR